VSRELTVAELSSAIYIPSLLLSVLSIINEVYALTSVLALTQ
jgi:hypothetical protein